CPAAIAGGKGCDANATKSADGTTCTCKPGFTGDGSTCTDVNECDMGTATCDPHASCVNTLGSYTCQCEPGYTGSGKSCKCSMTCPNNQFCEVIAGAALCITD